MVDRLPSPRSPPVLLLPLFLSSLVLFFPLSSAEDATNITALPPTLNSNLTTPLASNSSPKAQSGSFIRGKCPYTVRIKTSCSSPPVTRDAVSLDFGDADHNEVYAARLDDPASGTFERCSVDTFRVVGPCGGRPCFLYLRRSGATPGDTHTAVTFAYEASLPDGVWYGFNLCHDGAGAALHSDTAVRPSRAKVDDNGGRDEDDKGDKGDPTIKMKTKVSGSVQTVFIKM
ncbi:unnamed protein product [Spirodela intermedia]|uniref:Uncharacterized protein n=1 Tax=Spirodela intermedia TaxID=51605 RepID=A0A7I8J8Q4_SPIIN|nr:unnamed protein product [Spirodela intermedia]CAA6666411.1 unnamed protein product [Spirodela intermedia]